MGVGGRAGETAKVCKLGQDRIRSEITKISRAVAWRMNWKGERLRRLEVVAVAPAASSQISVVPGFVG